jgi:hypothetical protein
MRRLLTVFTVASLIACAASSAFWVQSRIAPWDRLCPEVAGPDQTQYLITSAGGTLGLTRFVDTPKRRDDGSIRGNAIYIETVGQIRYWIPCAFFGAMGAFLIWLRGWRLPRSSGCPKCGYDLRASPERCPECGTSAPSRL